MPKFNEIIKKHKLDVNRHEEGVIYSRFNGNDVKRLCLTISALKSTSTYFKINFLAVSNLPEYQTIIFALEVFDAWCRLVSTTETDLSDEHCQAISCQKEHSVSFGCCQTARIGKVLDDLGGFGTSGLVHVMISHLGPFVWEHRKIGALAEEGLEAVHCKLGGETKRHKQSPQESLKNSLKWLAIDVLLSDSGYIHPK